MIRFIQLSAITRLCNAGRPLPKKELRRVVKNALVMDAALKARLAAGRIGLS